MYKILGVGLLGLFALLAIPAIQQDIQTTYMGGMATLVIHNALGEELMFQQVHNQIVDEGERLIVGQLFANGTAALSDSNQIALICAFIRADGQFVINDKNNTNLFNRDNQNSSGGEECLSGFRVDLNGHNGTAGDAGVNGTAVIGNATGLAFQGSNGNNNIGEDNVLTGIGIFTGVTKPSGEPVQNTNILFALVDTGNVVVGADDTINISYTFDISDSNN